MCVITASSRWPKFFIALALLLALISHHQIALGQETVPTDATTQDAGEETVSAQGPSEVTDATAPTSPAEEVIFWRPILAMTLGVFVVLALMIGLKVHAFVALILGALAISVFVPFDITGFAKLPEPHVIRGGGDSPDQIVKRVANALGGAVSGIGILIAMAAIIGKCMLVSGAADRIVKSSLAILGEKRAALAMMLSGFVLSIPVFFDTVFYLLVPLARSLYRKTGKDYLLYLAAIAAGGAITHTLVPPTPGPLLVAETLKVNIGTVMMIGLAVGLPSAMVGLVAAMWLNRVMPIEMRPMAGNAGAAEEKEFTVLPSLWLAVVPVLLPVLLISTETVFSALIGKEPDKVEAVQVVQESDAAVDSAAEETAASQKTLRKIQGWLKLFGNPNFAMVVAALFAIFLCWKVQGHSLTELADHVEDALLSGGVIILITAAGGAFGALLAMTEIQEVVKSLFEGNESGGLIVIVVAYVLAAIIKVAQGSSTVAMIIASSLVATIAFPLIDAGTLSFNPAYLVPVIGSGSLMGSWMNDSGFWVFARMGVLTEGETLRSWTVLLSILSVTGFLITLAMAMLLPLTS